VSGRLPVRVRSSRQSIVVIVMVTIEPIRSFKREHPGAQGRPHPHVGMEPGQLPGPLEYVQMPCPGGKNAGLKYVHCPVAVLSLSSVALSVTGLLSTPATTVASV
jgi:hypothetical protein